MSGVGDEAGVDAVEVVIDMLEKAQQQAQSRP